jgi:aminoglycoside phosphotransferase (APT) family kinase protein
VTAGISQAAVSAWLLASIDGMRAPLCFEHISGGRSNLTYAVTDACGRRVVLRRPPLSHVLATAHDMSREYRLISALRATPVPVPDALGFCADEAVNGSPFYVMEFVDGYVLRGAAEAEAAFDPATRMTAGQDLVDVLATLHRVDVDAVGLGDFARRDGYVERQLRRWHGQFLRSQQQAGQVGVYRSVPLVGEVYDLLAGQVPAQQGTAIVHGDYRLDNTVISAEGRVKAVLDWELCTLGDPLADVGTLIAYWDTPQLTGPAGQPGPPATALPGFQRPDDVARRYAARSGRDLSRLAFYVAFALWKQACILEGVFVRYAANAMAEDTGQAAAVGLAVQDRARRAMEVLRP